MTNSIQAPDRALPDVFRLDGRVIVVTGAAGLLGQRHVEAIVAAGGIPVLLDLAKDRVEAAAAAIGGKVGQNLLACACDITREMDVESVCSTILARYGKIDGLVNNAANNPKVENGGTTEFSRLENFPLRAWQNDLAVGLTGAFICSRVFGQVMAKHKNGVILNIASDLSVIAPDQRLYRQNDRPPDQQPVKPVTYSVVKAGLVGLTKYLSTYWVDHGVRCNALSPGGVFNGQPEDFVQRLAGLIPMGRMAAQDEYDGAVVFLLSDASRYMTGQNILIDGGRTAW